MDLANRQQGAMALVNAYRTWGHLDRGYRADEFIRARRIRCWSCLNTALQKRTWTTNCRQWRVPRSHGRYVARPR